MNHMSEEEHRLRHVALHNSFDELLADYMTHTKREGGEQITQRPIIDLLQWSYKQTQEPDENSSDEG